jgi:hypothetical protein
VKDTCLFEPKQAPEGWDTARFGTLDYHTMVLLSDTESKSVFDQ